MLVREEVYDYLSSLFTDDVVCATGELVDKIMAEDDANDPTLASYQSMAREDVR